MELICRQPQNREEQLGDHRKPPVVATSAGTSSVSMVVLRMSGRKTSTHFRYYALEQETRSRTEVRWDLNLDLDLILVGCGVEGKMNNTRFNGRDQLTFVSTVNRSSVANLRPCVTSSASSLTPHDDAKITQIGLENGTDYYALLGVERDATDEEIVRAWRGLVLVHHPDKQKQQSTSHAQSYTRTLAQSGQGKVDIRLVNEAKWVLSDPARRREWEHSFFDCQCTCACRVRC